MASEQEIVDSPTEWVADHIARYVQSNGEDGHIWQGVPTLLLTTVGKVSGANRRTALIYGRIGNDYVIVASKGGHPTHPLWYNNLVSHPTVRWFAKHYERCLCALM
jgi:deazaflavin-dependent oxidoreductase (nitroreductase family)